MNETIKRMIEEMGETWAMTRDRATSPVLIKLDEDQFGKVFELSLPKGEGHPYWRVDEREMATEEWLHFNEFIGSHSHTHIGGFVGSYQVRAYVYNARRADCWMNSIDMRQKAKVA